MTIVLSAVVLLCKECEKYSVKEPTLSKHLSKSHRSILVTSPQGSGHCRAHAEGQSVVTTDILKTLVDQVNLLSCHSQRRLILG